MVSNATDLIVRACVVLWLGTFAFGCASNRDSKAAIQRHVQALTDLELRLSRLVVDGEELGLTAGRPVTVRLLNGGKIAGQGPVNRFSGNYQLGPRGVITWPGGGVAGTRMSGSAEAMELEQSLLAGLAATSILEASATGVTFRTGDRKTRVEFARPGFN